MMVLGATNQAHLTREQAIRMLFLRSTTYQTRIILRITTPGLSGSGSPPVASGI